MNRRNRKRRRSVRYDVLEPRNLLASVVASYGSDFPDAGELPMAGWQYQWNAPPEDNPVGGAIVEPQTIFSPLTYTGQSTSWTPDGDLIPGNDPASAYVRLSAVGGHPGPGLDSQIDSAPSRYSIASYEVGQSGFYEIADSFIGLNPKFAAAKSDGVEYRVFVNRDAPLEFGVVAQGTRSYFDTSLGFLVAGDVIHVAFGASGNQSFDYFTTDFDIVRETDRIQTQGSFREGVSTANLPGSEWKFLWNAPANWRGGLQTGDQKSGSIGEPASYRELVQAGSSWTADGDLVGSNSGPDYYLRFNPTGGVVGLGVEGSIYQDRFAIAAFTVDHSGVYAITDSFLSVADASRDGIELVVHVGDRPALAEIGLVVPGGGWATFDTGLGYLKKGETVYVGYGANGNHVYDRFETDFSIARELPRAAPDLSLLNEQGTVVLVNHGYQGVPGAIANDRQNDWEAFKNAFDYAINIGAHEIRLGGGTYDLTAIGLAKSEALFRLAGVTDLVINGNRSTLIVDDFTRPLFSMIGSSNIIIKDLTVDYAQRVEARSGESNDLLKPLTFTQGFISDLNHADQTFTLTVNTEAFVAPDTSFEIDAAQGWGYALDRFVDGRLKAGSQWHYPTIGVTPGATQLPSTTHQRFTINVGRTTGLANGDRYVMQRRHNVAMFGIYNDSENVSIVNVTAYSAPSVFVGTSYSRSVNVIDSHVGIRPDDWPATPDTQRWKSINGDGIHVQSSRVGVWVENSTFEGLGDDVMNFYSRPMAIYEQLSETEFTLALALDSWGRIPKNALRVGDHLTFFDPVAGKVVNDVVIVDVQFNLVPDPASADGTLIRLTTITTDQPVHGVVIGSNEGENGFRDDTTVFNQELSRSFVVEGNRISNSRRYGNYLMASDVQLIDNVYEGLSDEAIAAHNEPGWPLGLFSNNVLIQGNEFINNGFSRNYLLDEFHTGVIGFQAARFVDPSGLGIHALPDHLVDTNDYFFSNIQIRDNAFYQWQKSAISIRNATEVTIFGNAFSGGSSLGNGAENVTPLDIHFSQDVEVDRNVSLGGGAVVTHSNVEGLVETNTDVVSDHHLRVWLKFDKGKVLQDSSGNGVVPVFHAAGIVGGRFDTAALFNSTNRVSLDEVTDSSISNRTVGLWFNVDDANISARKQVVFEEGNASRGLNIYIENGQLFVGGWSVGNFTTFLDTAIVSGRWHHVALVIDANSHQIRGYLDGLKFESGDAGIIPPTGTEISLGQIGSDGTRFHSGVAQGLSNGVAGRIDDVRIYDRVLEDDEINGLAGNGLWLE